MQNYKKHSWYFKLTAQLLAGSHFAWLAFSSSHSYSSAVQSKATPTQSDLSPKIPNSAALCGLAT